MERIENANKNEDIKHNVIINSISLRLREYIYDNSLILSIANEKNASESNKTHPEVLDKKECIRRTPKCFTTK